MKRTLAFVAAFLSLVAHATAQGPTATLDGSFGRGGVEYTNLGAPSSTMNGVRGMALQPDGKVVVVGLGLVQFGNAPLLARFNADGTIDKSFNSTGYTAAEALTMHPHALALQGDGKIVVAGGDFKLAVARFNADGSVDTSFNGTGEASAGAVGGSAQAIAVQADGKIVVAGYLVVMGGPETNNDFALARFNPDGTADLTFGVGGVVTTPLSPGKDEFYAVAVQADGRIVAGGATSANGGDFVVARYNPDGTLDTTFAGTGISSTTMSSSLDQARALRIAADGKIVAAGFAGPAFCCGLDGSGFAFARYNTDGTLDTTFNGKGWADYRFSGGQTNSMALSLALHPDGRILAAGSRRAGLQSNIALVRVMADGALDPSFASGGRFTADNPYGIFGSGQGLNAVVLQPDGKAVAAGGSGPGSDYLLLRLDGAGSPDASFGRSGYATMPSSFRPDAAYGVAIQSDGKIVVAGSTDDLGSPDPLVLARYGTDGRMELAFGGGRASYTHSANQLSSAHAYGLAIQGDGRMVVAGDVVTTGFNTGSFPTSNFLVVRVGASGSVETPVQTTLENFSTAKAVRIQGDGKIVAAGFTRTNASFQPPGTKHVAVVRYNADLSLDAGFNGTGKVVTTQGTGDAEANAVAIRADGTIITAGSARNATNQDWAFVFYSETGAPTGSLLMDVSAGSDDAINAMLIQPEGAIVVAGSAGSQAAIARFTSPGIYDKSFGNGGRLTIAGSPFAALALQADGRIVAVTRDFQVWRFMASGVPDWTFGVGGRFALAMGAGSAANAVAVQADGRIVVAGNADGGFGQDFAVARIDPGIGPSLVTHYYQSILRRAPDAGGKAFWDNEAIRATMLGANVNEAWYAMAQAFFFSGEYAAFNRSNTDFVTDLYTTFFDRAPDSAGLAHWKGQLDQGMPREVLLAEFMFSAEFRNFAQALFGAPTTRAEVGAVTDFYRGLLARLPDDGGFANWVGRFRTAQCQGQAAIIAEVEAISSAFTLSGEYAARERTNAQYVGDLYNAFLRRGGDLPGVQHWIGQFDSGAMTREQLRVQFKNSAEFQARVQAIVAQGCLN